MEIHEAEERFRALGLLVRTWPDAILVSTGLIDRKLSDYGEGVGTYENTSGILRLADGTYRATFPTRGIDNIEIPGTLEESVELVERVYRHFQNSSKPFLEAIREIVRSSEIAPRVASSRFPSDGSIVPA